MTAGRFIVITFLVGLCAEVGHAQIAYEPMNYPVGNMLNGTATTATGFSGAWSVLLAPTEYAAVTAGSLSYPGMPTNANKLENGHNLAVENLNTSAFSSYLDGNSNVGLDGTTLYLGVLINTNVNTLGGSGYTAFELYKDGTSAGNRRITIDRWSGHGDNGNNYFLSAWNGTDGGATTAAASAAVGNTSTHLFVLKFLFGVANADIVQVFVDPNFGSEPALPTATINVTDASFDRLGTANFASSILTVDEIRLGASFIDVVPEPASLSLCAAGAALLLRRRQMN